MNSVISGTRVLAEWVACPRKLLASENNMFPPTFKQAAAPERGITGIRRSDAEYVRMSLSEVPRASEKTVEVPDLPVPVTLPHSDRVSTPRFIRNRSYPYCFLRRSLFVAIPFVKKAQPAK